MARARHACDRPGLERFAIHDRGVEFIFALGGEHRAAPGVEQGIVLEHAHRRGHGIERRAALVEHRAARAQRFVEPGAIGLLLFRGERAALDHPRTAVDRERPARNLDDLARAYGVVVHEHRRVDLT